MPEEAAASEVTQLLLSLQNGERSALDQLAPLLYGELRRIAASMFRSERPGHTLQPTAVVNEAWMRLLKQDQVHFTTRAHFFGAASRLMRQILVDYARSHQAGRRGGGEVRLALDEKIHASLEKEPGILALHEALDELGRLDEVKARAIELRYFGGLTGEEIAEVLGISTATVTRNLRMAEAWLARELGRA